MTGNNSELSTIETRVESYIATNLKQEVQIKLLNKKVMDFPELGFDDYFQVKSLHDYKEVNIGTRPVLDYETKFLQLIGKKKELSIQRFSIILPFVVIAIFIFLSFYLSNYWLLISLSLYPISQFTSTKNNFLGSLLFFVAIALSVYLGIKGNLIYLFFSLGYLLMHFSFFNLRVNYRNAILNRALQSESLFLFLLYYDYIYLWRIRNNRQERIRIE